jgi:hypothetical protein
MQVLVSAFYFGYADGLSCVDGVKPGPSFPKKAYASILVQWNLVSSSVCMVLALSVARRNASEATATMDFGGLGLYWPNYIKISVAVDDH